MSLSAHFEPCARIALPATRALPRWVSKSAAAPLRILKRSEAPEFWAENASLIGTSTVSCSLRQGLFRSAGAIGILFSSRIEPSCSRRLCVNIGGLAWHPDPEGKDGGEDEYFHLCDLETDPGSIRRLTTLPICMAGLEKPPEKNVNLLRFGHLGCDPKIPGCLDLVAGTSRDVQQHQKGTKRDKKTTGNHRDGTFAHQNKVFADLLAKRPNRVKENMPSPPSF
jgi:hypothetical protein